MTPGLARAAGPGGLLPLEVQNERLTVRVVGGVSRFPSTYGELVLLDGSTARTVLDTTGLVLQAHAPEARDAHALTAG